MLRRLLTALPAPNTPDAAARALATRHRTMPFIGFGAAAGRWRWGARSAAHARPLALAAGRHVSTRMLAVIAVVPPLPAR